MKQLTYAIAIAFVLGSALSATAGPEVEFSGGQFNFGKITQGKTLTHAFWIKSVGDDTLRIVKVDAGCSCTKAPLKDSVLAPGDSTALIIAFGTGRYRGHVNKGPSVLTNASEEPQKLKIFAHVITQPEDMSPLLIDPPVIDVSQFGDKSRRRARFAIKNASDKDLNLSITDSLLKSFRIELPELIKAGETVQATITVSKDKVGTEFEESFTFRVDDFDATVYTVPVKRALRNKR